MKRATYVHGRLRVLNNWSIFSRVILLISLKQNRFVLFQFFMFLLSLTRLQKYFGEITLFGVEITATLQINPYILPTIKDPFTLPIVSPCNLAPFSSSFDIGHSWQTSDTAKFI